MPPSGARYPGDGAICVIICGTGWLWATANPASFTRPAASISSQPGVVPG